MKRDHMWQKEWLHFTFSHEPLGVAGTSCHRSQKAPEIWSEWMILNASQNTAGRLNILAWQWSVHWAFFDLVLTTYIQYSLIHYEHEPVRSLHNFIRFGCYKLKNDMFSVANQLIESKPGHVFSKWRPPLGGSPLCALKPAFLC